MPYQRTQVSLTPEDHAFLTREAAARGVSLAELFRQIVADFRSGREGSAPARDFAAVVGLAAGTPDTDAMDAAMDDLYDKKMGRGPRRRQS